MVKKGFTLSELLIALGVIGVLASLTAPSIRSIMPDKNKIKILNIYNTILSTNTALLNNKNIYGRSYNIGQTTETEGQDGVVDTETELIAKCFGLACVGKPSDTDYQDCSGSKKYKCSLFKALEMESGTDEQGTDEQGNIWLVEPTVTYTSGSDVFNTDYHVTIQLKGEKECFYNNETCKRPGKYRFIVNKYGEVAPVDAMTAAYLRNPLNMNDWETDSKKAESLLEIYPTPVED